MCKNIKCKPLTYRCNRKSCNKLVHIKDGCKLTALIASLNVDFSTWQYCEDCFNEIVEIISDFNKTDLSDIYSRAKYIGQYVLFGKQQSLEELKDLYEGKSYKEKIA